MTTANKRPPETDTSHNFHPSYRPDIDGLRAVAILSVVLFHAFPTRLQGGFVGVDIFFVISGFLISTIIFRSLQKNDFSFIEFYAHRVKRIFPALIVVLAASYTFGWFALLPDEFKQLGKHMAAGAGFVQNFVLWKEAGYFDTASELKPLMHLWSLAIEEQFYLIFPVMIWAAWRGGLNVLTVVILLALISFGLNVSWIEKDAVKTFFVPQTRFWELLAGSVLAYLQFFKPKAIGDWLSRWVFHRVIFKHPPVPAKQGAVLVQLTSVVGLLLIILAAVALHKGKPFPGWWALAPVVGAALLIFSGPNAWVNQKILGNRLMVFVGVISYPLYLWHWPILSFARIVESEMPAREIRVGAVALSFVLAWLTYRLVERPIRFGPKSWVKTAALCLALTAVGYVGFNAYERDGLGFRVKQFTRNLALFEDGNLPWATNEHCRARFPFASAAYCRISKDAAPSILVVGDSHSAALYPGIAELLIENSAEVVANIGRGGSVPFRDTTSRDRKEPQISETDTLRVFNQALDAAKNPDVRTVLLVSRGPLYLSGKGFTSGERSEEKDHDRVLRYHTRPDLTDHATIWEAAMRATLTELTAAGKRTIFLLDNPELGFDPRNCVDSRPLRLTHKNLRTPCALSRATFEERNRDYRALVTKVLADFPQTILVDGAKSLCDDQWCWAMKDGELLYLDDDHLSIYGARLVAQAIRPYLLLP